MGQEESYAITDEKTESQGDGAVTSEGCIEDVRERVHGKSRTEVRLPMHAVDGKGVANEPVEEFERPGKGTEDIDGILYGIARP